MAAGPKAGKVDKAHVVPRFLIKGWEAAGRVEVQLVKERLSFQAKSENVGTRRAFYRRHLPDGTPDEEAEAKLGRIESEAASVLEDIEAHWPLSFEDKSRVALFVAFQAVRGPRWKSWLDDFIAGEVAEERAKGAYRLPSGVWVPLPERFYKQFETRIRSREHWVERMFSIAPKLMTIYGSMTWDLLRFDSDVLALSDHPVVEWPFGEDVLTPGVRTGHGVTNVLEARLPLTPRLALLLTWSDRLDGILDASGTALAANANSFTVAAAERQWFRQPSSAVPLGVGPFVALSSQLLPNYSTRSAQRSEIRKAVTDDLEARSGVVDGENSTSMFRLSFGAT